MRLNALQVEETLRQLDVEVIPDDHPAATRLCKLFGNHTFFVDDRGLKVLEPADAFGMEVQSGEVISLADWSYGEAADLELHDPEQTGVIVVFRATLH